MKQFLLSLILMLIGAAFGWLLRDHQQISRLDTNIRQAILARNLAETRYFEKAASREDREAQPLNGYSDGRRPAATKGK